MDRIIFMNDILFHSPENKITYHTWIADIINPAIHCSCNQDVILFTDLKDGDGNFFDRNKFYSLSNIYDVSISYYSYDINLISQKSWDYLFSFIKKTDFIIGYELGLDLRNKLTEEKYLFINFWFHSFKLFDDICFMLNTNDLQLFNRIKKFQIPKEKFGLYGFITQRLLRRDWPKLKINDNCCVFIGQTLADKSVEKDGKFLNITDYADKLSELSKKYKTIYYVPHPAMIYNKVPFIDEFIAKRPYIKVLTDAPTYILLASPRVKKVVALSSSVLFEAQAMGKEIEYLFRPLFDIDEDFGLNTFISVYNDYMNPKFWIEILADLFAVKKDKENVILWDRRPNGMRDILGVYFGYKYVDPVMRLGERCTAIECQLMREIEQKKWYSWIYRREMFPDMVVRKFLGMPYYKRKSGHKYILGVRYK